jgi:Fic family protein
MPEPVPDSQLISHKWHEFLDLPDDIDQFRDRELEALFDTWTKEKIRFDPEQIKAFNSELAREWAIETGIIEAVYTLDRGITQTLIERGIDAAYIPHDSTNRDPELVARTIQAHVEVLEGLFAFVSGERTLSTGYIKELHSALLRHQDTVVVFDQLGQSFEQPLEKGRYKILPNNPRRRDGDIHEYCPPEHVASEMDRLVTLHGEHNAVNVAPHIEAAWIHHVFTQIHPFQDGNGRVARALATLVFIKRGLFPLTVNRDNRDRYIKGLETADEGNIGYLVEFFSQIQKRALTSAIGRAVDVKPVSTLDEALEATRNMLVDLGRIIPVQYLTAKTLAAGLANIAQQRFNTVVAKLSADISVVDTTFKFGTGELGNAPTSEIKLIAQKLQYDPNTNDYHKDLVITLTKASVASTIVVSFHSVGAAFRGLLVAASYFRSGSGQPIALSEDIFRFSYQETAPDVNARFSGWLDSCLIRGLALWRRTLL